LKKRWWQFAELDAQPELPFLRIGVPQDIRDSARGSAFDTAIGIRQVDVVEGVKRLRAKPVLERGMNPLVEERRPIRL
jgi:hypothetical protein